MRMTTKLQKLGNSYGLILPKSVAEQLGAEPGTSMSFKIVGEELVFKVVEKKSKAKKHSLKELLKGMTKKNLHREVDWGKPVGNEFW